MEQLLILNGRGQEVRVIEVITPRWKVAALDIGFGDSRIRTIEQDSPFSAEYACIDMFRRWRAGGHDLKPCTWQVLIEYCQNIGEKSLAKSLKSLCLTKDQVIVKQLVLITFYSL